MILIHTDHSLVVLILYLYSIQIKKKTATIHSTHSIMYPNKWTSSRSTSQHSIYTLHNNAPLIILHNNSWSDNLFFLGNISIISYCCLFYCCCHCCCCCCCCCSVLFYRSKTCNIIFPNAESKLVYWWHPIYLHTLFALLTGPK